MIGQLKSTIKKHTLISIYTLVLFLLLFGIIVSSGTSHLAKISAYILSLYGSYILFSRLSLGKKQTNWFKQRPAFLTESFGNKVAFGLWVYTLIAIIGHFAYLGSIPIFESMGQDSALEVAQIRERITSGAPRLLNYVGSFNIRAFIPFLILYTYVKNKKVLFWIILAVGSFYSFALMQKSFIFCILTPVLVYAFVKRKFIAGIGFFVLICSVIFLQLKVANPVKHSPKPVQVEQFETATTDEDSMANATENHKPNFLKGIANRIFVVPGEMIGKWFEIIPNQKPFLNGDGYRIVARLKGSEYHDYFAELYPIMYPKYAKRGLNGSVNTASFVMDYANFGILGLVLSGFLLSSLFIVIERLFKNDFKLKVSLNTYPILIISSTMLTTTLFSGGWGAFLGLYYVCLKDRVKPDKSNSIQS